MARIERVVVEEPLPEESVTATASAGVGESRSPEESLRYGTVEETDEGLAEGYDERRRAA